MPELWIPSNVEIDERLVKRFSLSDSPIVQNPYWLRRTIQPITNLDELLQDPGAQTVSKDLTPAAGTFTAYGTVPDGKRWIITRVRYPATAGTCYLAINDGTTTHKIGPSGTTEYAIEVRFILDPGWSIGLPTTGNGGDGAIYMTWLYLELNTHLI